MISLSGGYAAYSPQYGIVAQQAEHILGFFPNCILKVTEVRFLSIPFSNKLNYEHMRRIYIWHTKQIGKKESAQLNR